MVNYYLMIAVLAFTAGGDGQIIPETDDYSNPLGVNNYIGGIPADIDDIVGVDGGNDYDQNSTNSNKENTTDVVYKDDFDKLKDVEIVINELSLNDFKDGNDLFSVIFLNEVISLNQGTSVILSPFSILYLLAQLALYTVGPSQKQLLQALNLYNDTEIRFVFAELTDAINNQQEVRFEIAARTYIDEKYNISESFSADTEIIFGAAAETVDFEQPNVAADTINLWVENKTNNLITDLVSPDMFNSGTVLVLVDAIYFKGDWINKFNSLNTQNRKFYIDSGNTIEIPTMYQRNSFYYAKNNEHGFEIISLPFEGGNFSLNILLPDKRIGVDALLNTLQDTKILYDAYNSLENVLVDLYLPKMEINTKIDLKETLEGVGITDIFTADSGIEGLLETPENLSVSSGIQKAVLKVNENGAEAAAASVLIIGRNSIIAPNVQFRANRPFLYFLVYEDITVFCGIFRI